MMAIYVAQRKGNFAGELDTKSSQCGVSILTDHWQNLLEGPNSIVPGLQLLWDV